MYLQVGKFILDECLKNCNVPINSLAKKYKVRKLSVMSSNRGVKVADWKESQETKKKLRKI